MLKDEKGLQVLIDGIKDHGIYMLNAQGLVESWNNGAQALMGYGSNEIIGQHFSRFFTKEDIALKKPQEILGKTLKEGRSKEERLQVRKDGSQFVGEVSMAFLKNDNDSHEGFSVVSRDITERKLFEENLKHQAEQLKAANKELEGFSYSVSHDLRVPLRAIDGFSRILLEEYNEKFDDEGKRLLGIIRTSTSRMFQLIEDLLAFSRMGRLAIDSVEVDMADLAKAAFEECRILVPDRNIQFELGTLPKARVDKAMMRQVFMNFFHNAIKFTRQRDNARIDVSCEKKGNENIYRIKDNGVGFDMNYVHKIFSVFQRLHTQEEFEGTGVGLALVEKVIKKHGGKVWAESKVNEGAIFYFSLPENIKEEE
jgi:PAS domain S-box-containing protein